MAGKMDEIDSFWDIEKLVPRKKTTLSPFTSQITHKDFSPEKQPQREERPAEERKLTQLGEVRKSEESSYTPRNNRFIKKVTINRTVDRFDFYDNFRKAALVYFDYKTEKCPFVPFYSYMPQYSQLNTEQKNYYFYWRSEIRRKKYPKSDYSYLYLYVYEILNLHDKILPEEGLRLLCDLWREYRSSLPRIDAYFSIWVQDYCLVWGLDCPTEYIKDFLFDVISVSPFKQFYLSDIDEAGEAGVGPMLAYLSDYDWRRGRLVSGENAELYKKHLYKAMYRVLSLVWRGDASVSGETKVLSRDAFPNSLCTHSVKCKLFIEYYSITEATDVRLAVTSAVRYTENKLRALFGIKSRLAVKEIPDLCKTVIDGYFNNIIAEEKKAKAILEMPEYERLYDAPRSELSFSDADEIEMASWSTTARLVSEEDVAQDEQAVNSASGFDAGVEEKSGEAPAPSTTVGADNYGLSEEELAFLACLLGESTDMERFSYREDELAERINECFSDNFGDVILENNGECYTVIADYTEEVNEWYRKLMK